MKKSFMKRLVALALVIVSVLSISATALAATSTWEDHYGPGNLSSSTSGDVNRYIRNLQHDLNIVIKAGLKVDGYYGTKTKQAVKDFQYFMNFNYAGYNLTIDGIAGPQTKAALYSLVKCTGDHRGD